MIRRLFVLLLFLLLFVYCDDSDHNNKNSIIMVPGWAGEAHIMFNLDYFWKLKEPLENAGFSVESVPLSCFAKFPDRSKELAAFIYLQIVKRMKEKMVEDHINDINKIDPMTFKFNIIGHSQGGVVSRYLIKALNIPDPRYKLPDLDVDGLDPDTLGDLRKLSKYITDDIQVDKPGLLKEDDRYPEIPKIAAFEFIRSIAMLSAPNNGTYFANWLVETGPDVIIKLLPGLANYIWAGFLNGQNNNDFTAATAQMTHSYMANVFNPALELEGKKTPAIKLFCYAGLFHEGMYPVPYPQFIPNFNYPVTSFFWNVIYPHEGSSDGIVPVESSLWVPGNPAVNGEWIDRGIIQGKYGVDHWMIINHFLDLENTALPYDATPGFNAPAFFINVAETLRDSF